MSVSVQRESLDRSTQSPPSTAQRVVQDTSLMEPRLEALPSGSQLQCFLEEDEGPVTMMFLRDYNVQKQYL